MICKRPSCDNPVPPNPYRGVTPLFCSKRCKNIEGVNTLRSRRKQRAVEFLGGRCSRCGYDKCMAALHFHHTRGKDFEINRGMTMTWEKIECDLRRCIVLCANCHAEEHWSNS